MASVSQCPACLRARRLSTPQRAAFFGPQELSNDLVSFARGGMISVPLLRAYESFLCEAVPPSGGGAPQPGSRLAAFSASQLNNLLWAFASLRWHPRELLPLLTRHVGDTIAAWTPRELSNAIWSFARQAGVAGGGSGGGARGALQSACGSLLCPKAGRRPRAGQGVRHVDRCAHCSPLPSLAHPGHAGLHTTPARC